VLQEDGMRMVCPSLVCALLLAGCTSGARIHSATADNGVWEGRNATVTLRVPHPGSKLVLVVYEPDDRARTITVTFAGAPAQSYCCVHAGISEAAFAVPAALRRHRKISFAMRVTDPQDARHGIILVRAFVY